MDFSKILKKFERAESSDERLLRLDLERRKLDAEVLQRRGALAQEEIEVKAAIMQEVSQPTQEQLAADKKAYDAWREPGVRLLRLNKFLNDPKGRKSAAYSDKENEANDNRLIDFYLSGRYSAILELFTDPAVILERLEGVDRRVKEQARLERQREKEQAERAREAEREQREREEEAHKAELDELKKHHYSGSLSEHDCSPRP